MSLENVPDVNSEEFAEFLEKNGFEGKFLNNCNKITNEEKFLNNCNKITNEQKDRISLKEKFNVKNIIKKIDQWSMNHPGTSLVIFFGGSGLICYKILQAFVAGAVFKGNVKTLRYISKISR